MKPSKINWRRECTNTIAELQRSANAALSFIWFALDTPRVVTMLPRNFQGLLPASQWIATAIKPLEAIGIFIKQLGTVVDLPDRWLSIRAEVQNEKNRWKRWSKLATTVYLSIDGLLLIPNSWKLLNLGKWAAMVGATPFGIERFKEGLTIWGGTCSAKGAGIERTKVVATMRRYRSRLDRQGPLAKLQRQLQKTESLSPQELSQIEQLRREYSKKTPAEKSAQIHQLKKDIVKLEDKKNSLLTQLSGADPVKSGRLTQEVADLNGQLSGLRQKAARKEVWNHPELKSLREVVSYKWTKCEIKAANADRERQKLTAGRWYDISKAVVLAFNNLLQLGVALFLAPQLGLSVATVSAFFFLGRWVTSLTTGVCYAGKIASSVRFKNPLPLPQTYLKV
ncbi:MAG: hypothetical protein LLG04_04420 [Parachlamydia sp.]|nr:hypothetical protein [Parachlamydia sp.]